MLNFVVYNLNGLVVDFGLFSYFQVCKLMFLLEDLIFERPDDAEVTNFLKVSFCTVLETSSKGSKSSLQHCIKFFADMVTKKKIKHEILESAW